MKKLILTTICILAIATVAYAGAPVSLTSNVNANVAGVFSMEWEDNVPTVEVTYANGGPLPFTNIDPTLSQVNTDGYVNTKSDIALICKSNEATTWGIKTSVSAGLLTGKLLYYMGQPTMWNGTASVPTNGLLANTVPAPGDPWPVIPENSVIYTSGGNDTINTPFGSYCGMSIAINPSGLVSGSAPVATITYTMTQAL